MMLVSPLKAQQSDARIVNGTVKSNLNFGTTANVTVYGNPSRGQDLSKLPKMERDIIILENVLSDMFRDSGTATFASPPVDTKGIHIPGKGVIFNAGNQSAYSSLFSIKNAKFNSDNEIKEKDIVQSNGENESKLRRISQDFLLNYGSILGELKDDEFIMLNVKFSPLGQVTQDGDNGSIAIFLDRKAINEKKMTSSIQYKDLKDLNSGKLSFDEARAKVKTKIVGDANNESSDTKIMAGILDDLFESTFDGTYRKSGRTSWTYFEGFGLMYNLNISPYPTGSSRVVFYSKQSLGINLDEDQKKESEDQARNAKIALDDLIDLAKESLVTYGRTLRSVKSDEVIILNLNFSGFFGTADLPKSVRISVNKSQIDQLSKGSISLEQLKKEIDVKKLTSSISNNDFGLAKFPTSHSNFNQGYSIRLPEFPKSEGKN
jgi:hypothetical protein